MNIKNQSNQNKSCPCSYFVLWKCCFRNTPPINFKGLTFALFQEAYSSRVDRELCPYSQNISSDCRNYSYSSGLEYFYLHQIHQMSRNKTLFGFSPNNKRTYFVFFISLLSIYYINNKTRRSQVRFRSYHNFIFKLCG